MPCSRSPITECAAIAVGMMTGMMSNRTIALPTTLSTEEEGFAQAFVRLREALDKEQLDDTARYNVELIFEVRGLPEKTDSKAMDKYRGASVGVVVQYENGHILCPDYNDATAFDKDGNEIKHFTV